MTARGCEAADYPHEASTCEGQELGGSTALEAWAKDVAIMLIPQNYTQKFVNQQGRYKTDS